VCPLLCISRIKHMTKNLWNNECMFGSNKGTLEQSRTNTIKFTSMEHMNARTLILYVCLQTYYSSKFPIFAHTLHLLSDNLLWSQDGHKHLRLWRWYFIYIYLVVYCLVCKRIEHLPRNASSLRLWGSRNLGRLPNAWPHFPRKYVKTKKVIQMFKLPQFRVIWT
jgi:hypothetical protein